MHRAGLLWFQRCWSCRSRVRRAVLLHRLEDSGFQCAMNLDWTEFQSIDPVAPDSFEVVVKPFQHVLHPIKSNHLWKGFTSSAAQFRPVVKLHGTVWVIMVPLPKQSTGFDTAVDEPIDGGNGHVRVNVPIMHALNQVNAPLVVLEHPVEEVPFLPVGACDLRTEHVSAYASTWSQ